MTSKRPGFYFLRTVLLLGIGLAGCQSGPVPGPSVSPAQQTATLTLPAATNTAFPPTPTSEPLALRVNGEGITLAGYQAELGQLQEAYQALGKTGDAAQQRQQVLDNLTDTLLLAQGAAEAGFQVDDAALQAEIDRLTAARGGEQGLRDWMAKHGYSEPAFRSSLRRNLAAAWQRDQVIATVPIEMEQIHARQILTQDETIAKRALEIVQQPGTNFAAYANQYDSQTGGDLGWFPRGYLTQPEVEEAAFQLQAGQISPVVKSQIGYHIVQVISREPSRTLSPDARRVLQHKALDEWLKARREGSSVEVLIP